MYSFHSVAGYSKIGSYTGNGSATGPIVTLGFEPAWIMIKRSSSNASGGNWIIKDNKRDTTNPNTQNLYANLSAAEENAYPVDFNSNNCSLTQRVEVGTVFTKSSDWRMVQNPASVSGVFTYFT